MEVTTKTPLARRVVAWLIDYVVIWCIVWLVLNYQTFATADQTGNYGFAGCGILLLCVALYFSYFAIPEAIWGQSIGKAMVSIEVRTIEGRRASLTACFKRRLLDVVDFQFFALPAFITVKVTPLGQRVGDLFARTIVVREASSERPLSNAD